jgi:hypothetical protein
MHVDVFRARLASARLSSARWGEGPLRDYETGALFADPEGGGRGTSTLARRVARCARTEGQNPG